jgi:hypothetical protein
MGDLSTHFIKAWERYTGLEWTIDHQGGFGDSYRDFKAGWDAAQQPAAPVAKCMCGSKKMPLMHGAVHYVCPDCGLSR